MKTAKDVCKQCLNRTAHERFFPEWNEADDDFWEKGRVYCRWAYIGKSNNPFNLGVGKFLRGEYIATDEIPEKCPYRTERVITADGELRIIRDGRDSRIQKDP